MTKTVNSWHCHMLAGFLIAVTASLRLAYLAHSCPLDLSPDEAHYWDWSRHLDWSYYSKGPLVAWMIRASCGVCGGWLSAVAGSETFAVRLPAVLCGSLLLASLYVLTVQVYRRAQLAVAVVGMALTLPLLGVGSSLMTIDAPYLCCWGWALVAAYQAIFSDSRWAWSAAGLLIGIGILAKYTMVLFVPSLFLFLLCSPGCRRRLSGPGFYAMATVAALSCLPIVIWNWQNDWVTLRHTLGHAGLGAEKAAWSWLGPVTFLGQQFAILLGFWFLAWVGALLAHRPGKIQRPEVAFLWWMSAPMFGVFLLFSFKNGGGEANWPMAAYVSGLVLVAAWLARLWHDPRPWPRRLVRGGLMATCAVGLILNLFLFSDAASRPVLAWLAGAPTPHRALPLRRLDPTCRLRGWRTLAAELDRLRDELRAQGIEPVLAAGRWNLPGELGFYCTGQPEVFSVGAALGDRHSQYDLWRPNPVADADRFCGRTFILVSNGMPALATAFDEVEPPRLVTHIENDLPVAEWLLFVGHGFRGFDRPGERLPHY